MLKVLYILEPNGGTDETVRIHSDQGTGFNAKGNSTDASKILCLMLVVLDYILH